MRPNCRAFNEVETRHEILKILYKSSIITDTENRDLGGQVRRCVARVMVDAIARVAPQ